MTRAKTTKLPAIYLRASAWRTWQTCALSLIIRDESAFEAEPDEFAAEGTKIHAAIESDLKNLPRERYDLETEAIIDFAVRVTRTEAADAPIRTEVFTDQRVTVGPKQYATIGGTADAIIDTDDTITIVDHKTGWKTIEAEHNEQLKIYAHLNRKQSQTAWRGVIINARLNNISITGPHPFEKDYLKNLAADAVKRAAARQTQVGNHCAYCPALSRCEPVRAAIKKWIQPGADDGLKDRKADWSELLNLAKPFENLIKRAKSDAMKYLELGGEIPGVSFELSGGTRAWPRDLSECELAAALGVTVEQITTREIMSPAQAEKAGIDGEKIRALAIQPLRRGLKVTVAKS